MIQPKFYVLTRFHARKSPPSNLEVLLHDLENRGCCSKKNHLNSTSQIESLHGCFGFPFFFSLSLFRSNLTIPISSVHVSNMTHRYLSEILFTLRMDKLNKSKSFSGKFARLWISDLIRLSIMPHASGKPLLLTFFPQLVWTYWNLVEAILLKAQTKPQSEDFSRFRSSKV